MGAFRNRPSVGRLTKGDSVKAPNLNKLLEASGPFDPDAMSVADARREIADAYTEDFGYASCPKLLTAPENQLKLGKSARPTYGLTLAPADASGFDVCTWRTPECTAACVLTTAGNARYDSVRDARVVKTRVLAAHPQAFVTVLAFELREAIRKVGPIDFRPNVGSDLRWERIAPAILTIPDVRVYDYTKAPARHREASADYRLTFSVSERDASVSEALEYLRSGGNAAVVFATKKGQPLPETWNGFAILDGDVSDSRVDDAPGTVVGLRAKGAARGDNSGGFVKAAVNS